MGDALIFGGELMARDLGCLCASLSVDFCRC